MSQVFNAIDTQALRETIDAISEDPNRGKMAFAVNTVWDGQFRTESRPADIQLGSEIIERDFVIAADEPEQLLGKNSAANPQELLLSALNACMSVGYIATAAMMGVNLTRLEIKTDGELDLRGFLGLDKTVKPGYDNLNYQVTIAGDGSSEQFKQIHQTVIASSPNRFNLAMPIQLNSRLTIA